MARLYVSAPPTEEPVSLVDVKEHLRIDDSASDWVLNSYIRSAMEQVEAVVGPIMPQTIVQTEDAWPTGARLPLRVRRVQSISSVIYTDEDGNSHTLAEESYTLDPDEHSPAVVLTPDRQWPTVSLWPVDGISITCVAGFSGANSVPERIRHAIMLLVAHAYEMREPVVVGSGLSAVLEIPWTVQQLIGEYRSL